MNKTKLLALADHMEKVKAKTYDQDSWVEGRITSRKAEFKLVGKDAYGDDRYLLVAKEGFCATTACVLGHGPSVKDSVLMLTTDSSYTANGRRYTDDVSIAFAIDGDMDQLVYGMEAAHHAYDIPYNHATVLFNSSETPRTFTFYTGKSVEGVQWSARQEEWKKITPQIVAAKLREYVATNGKTVQDLL